MWFLRMAKTVQQFFDQFSVWYQNQNYLSWSTTSHIKFGSGPKTRVTVTVSSFRPKNRVFDHLDTMLYCSMSFRDENFFYCGPIWPRLVVVHKKKKLEIEKFFTLKLTKKWLFFGAKKIHVPPISPKFWWYPPKISIKML